MKYACSRYRVHGPVLRFHTHMFFHVFIKYIPALKKYSMLISKEAIMKYIRQFEIILAISFTGEILHALIPLPIPASIYGLVLILVALISGVLKVHQVKDASKFLIEIMPMMFIPATAGLIDSWGILKPVLLPVIAITIISTVLVMGVAGRVTQMVIKRGERKAASNKEGGQR